ncbi:hypothetical protein HAX54_026626, partial [Datura stramonium]|nr:hypothetical protein [Datura stramonium]
ESCNTQKGLSTTFLGHQYDMFLIEPILFSEQSVFRTSVEGRASLAQGIPHEGGNE